jgi:hypothetical protein
MAQHCLDRLLRLWEEGEVGGGILLEEGLYCQVVHYVFGDYPCSVLGVPELESLAGYAFQLLLQLDEVGCSRQYDGAACSISLELLPLPQ